MVVTEYEGSDRVKAECSSCGFIRWLHNPSTRTLLKLRCWCAWSPDASREEGHR